MKIVNQFYANTFSSLVILPIWLIYLWGSTSRIKWSIIIRGETGNHFYRENSDGRLNLYIYINYFLKFLSEFIGVCAAAPPLARAAPPHPLLCPHHSDQSIPQWWNDFHRLISSITVAFINQKIINVVIKAFVYEYV